MAAHICPFCKQTLPKGVDAAALQRRMDNHIDKAAEQRLLDRGRKEGERSAHHGITELESELSKARTQNALNARRMEQVKRKNEAMQAQLERQSNDERGELSEAEAFDALHKAFPSDKIIRITKSIGGADTLHSVMVDGKAVGTIVYEIKNTQDFEKKWIATAKQYRARYQTPWVIIASKTLPRRTKHLTHVNGVPVVDLRSVVALAEVVREFVITEGQLRLSQTGRHTKADQLFEYILSHQFGSRFNRIAEAVTELRDLQTKDQKRHTQTWTEQTRLFQAVDEGHTEIHSHIRSIAEPRVKPRLKPVVGNGRVYKTDAVSA